MERRNGAFPAPPLPRHRKSNRLHETTFIHPCSSHCGSMVARFTCIRLLATWFNHRTFKRVHTRSGRFCSFSVKPGDYRIYPSLDSDRMQFVRGRGRGYRSVGSRSFRRDIAANNDLKRGKKVIGFRCWMLSHCCDTVRRISSQVHEVRARERYWNPRVIFFSYVSVEIVRLLDRSSFLWHYRSYRYIYVANTWGFFKS